jgi:hypothetical protein
MTFTKNIASAVLTVAVFGSLSAYAQVQDVEINPTEPIQAVVNDGVHPAVAVAP